MNSSGNNTGYSWTNTSQWSQLPTSPAANGSQTGTSNTNQTQNSTTPPQTMNTAPVISTEPRRDMVSRLYKTILGREADTAGLNYYLFNSNITEQQIAKEMYESTEHQSIIGRSKDVREMVLKLDALNKENNELKTKLHNAESLYNSYKALLDQKTQIINNLQSNRPQIQPQEQSNQTEQNKQTQPQSPQKSESIFLSDPFSENSSDKKKGCIGWITNWFKFS